MPSLFWILYYLSHVIYITEISKLSNFKRISNRTEPDSIELNGFFNGEPYPNFSNFLVIFERSLKQLNLIHHLNHLNASYWNKGFNRPKVTNYRPKKVICRPKIFDDQIDRISFLLTKNRNL